MDIAPIEPGAKRLSTQKSQENKRHKNNRIYCLTVAAANRLGFAPVSRFLPQRRGAVNARNPPTVLRQTTSDFA